MSSAVEAEFGVLLDVEELGRLEMGGEVLVLHVHARDLCGALERRAIGVDGEVGPDLVESALERSGEVGNLEVHRRVNGIEAPGTGRGYCQSCCTHELFCSFRCVVYY